MRYSKQREAIWNYLKDRKDHPTADMVYMDIRKTIPAISLGTVYRNIMQLKDIGKLRTVEVGDGIVHFDPDVSIHDHFICKECGEVIDLNGIDPHKIREEASKGFSGQIDGYCTYFYGICAKCLKNIP